MWTARYAGVAAIAFAAAWLGHAASAQTPDELVSRGQINVGVNLDAPPYGSINSKQEPEGFDVDVARLMGKYLGVKVNIVRVQGPTRIPYLMSNRIDFIIADLGITPARALQVMFSQPYGALDGYIYASKGRRIIDAADLKGLRIGVPRASTFDSALTPMVGNTATVMRYDDDATTIQALISGQVDAVGENEATMGQLVKLNASLDVDKKFRITQQVNGIAVRKGQFELLQWVNTFVGYTARNGELDGIYRKWLNEPLPDELK
jgi:polar amino acid transport system substrate-binding protein